jgi:hypothetical protein
MTQSIQWLPFELHCHTFHSDGKQSLSALALAAKALGLHGVALTDHNTMTGLTDRDKITAETGVDIIPGLEWTTFFGHMLTLGIREYVDWRNLSPFHIHRGIHDVHRQGGVVGVAHPYRVGSPMCTGCFWEFEVTDWSEVDYIEVWSGVFPSIHKNNARAFAMWTDLLNQGYRIAATSGRDWHVSSEPVRDPVSATYLGMTGAEQQETDVTASAVKALKYGSVAVSMGPRPELSVLMSSGAMAHIGEVACIPRGGSRTLTEVTVGADYSARAGHWELPEHHPLKVRLVSNQGELAVMEITKDKPQTKITLSLAGVRWVRAELIGTFCGAHTMIGFTNAIYLKEVD